MVTKKQLKLLEQWVAKRAIEKGITEVVFDRGGYVYHGRVQVFSRSCKRSRT